MQIIPDTKDWTWVLEEPCGECGYDAATVTGPEVARMIRASLPRWVEALGRPDVTTRPEPSTWSVTEYGCHARDVFDRFSGRIGRMLTEDDPALENWDQDATAVEDRYDLQEPAVVAPQLVVAGERLADLVDTITDEQWSRPGRRSDGARFTVESFLVYFAHDLRHHLVDVGASDAGPASSRP